MLGSTVLEEAKNMMMKRYVLCLLAVFILSGGWNKLDAGEKPKLQWKKMAEGVTLAAKTNKKVLIDIYTDWCGWCKKMDAEVYSNQKVIKYLDETFVVIKMNAESQNVHEVYGKKMTEAQLAEAFGVRGYPSTVFLKADGETITLVPGYITADKLLQVLKFIGEDHYQEMSFKDYLSKVAK